MLCSTRLLYVSLLTAIVAGQFDCVTICQDNCLTSLPICESNCAPALVVRQEGEMQLCALDCPAQCAAQGGSGSSGLEAYCSLFVLPKSL